MYPPPDTALEVLRAPEDALARGRLFPQHLQCTEIDRRGPDPAPGAGDADAVRRGDPLVEFRVKFTRPAGPVAPQRHLRGAGKLGLEPLRLLPMRTSLRDRLLLLAAEPPPHAACAACERVEDSERCVRRRDEDEDELQRRADARELRRPRRDKGGDVVDGRAVGGAYDAPQREVLDLVEDPGRDGGGRRDAAERSPRPHGAGTPHDTGEADEREHVAGDEQQRVRPELPAQPVEPAVVQGRAREADAVGTGRAEVQEQARRFLRRRCELEVDDREAGKRPTTRQRPEDRGRDDAYRSECDVRPTSARTPRVTDAVPSASEERLQPFEKRRSRLGFAVGRGRLGREAGTAFVVRSECHPFAVVAIPQPCTPVRDPLPRTLAESHVLPDLTRMRFALPIR